ncbi:MAG: mandelate racemase/muconate lactonizing enzyme family protein [Pirellulaceae bacterium]|jgi:L-alanine-DL-glutamate epimerase-like enolase superfamily enzyme|nr:mandelate racemase/muconate lactonizing enzyme family protein [Pirellulaceae bacterium]MDP7018235.1 mandelate racemase/muconate lactonizing enzyme family protein [Pirellulaceae bacterium]
MSKISDYQIHRLRIPLRMPIGDSQVIFTEHWMTLLELRTDDGAAGVGFEIQQGLPTPALAQTIERFEYAHWPSLQGSDPAGVALGIHRPRGGNVGAAPHSLAVETAAWDLLAKRADLPLYQLLGGGDPRVRAYGSTLDFHLSDDEYRGRLTEFREMGFQSVKVKIGHPDPAWDLRRLGIAREVMGNDGDLMVDANEAWSPKEAMLRLDLYAREGFEIFWIEDPITRDDYAGYAALRSEIPTARINTGEYLGFSGKRRLLESDAVDVLNIHGHINQSRFAAHLAGDYGIPVSLGNTIMEIGVHLAASLPECLYLEFSDLAWNEIAVEPVRFRDGFAIAPDRPGHGIELNLAAVEKFSQPA